MKNEPISRAMTPSPATVTPEEPLAAAERVMRERRCHHVPVVDGGRLLGLVGSDDLVKAVFSADDARDVSPLRSRRVADCMRRNVVTLPQTATLLDAAKAFVRTYAHAMPVVAPGDILVGIVTWSDLVGILADGLAHPAAADDSDRAQPEGRGELQSLRSVYRATLSYLESGRTELEHTRLLQAVNRAREATRRVEVHI